MPFVFPCLVDALAVWQCGSVAVLLCGCVTVWIHGLLTCHHATLLLSDCVHLAAYHLTAWQANYVSFCVIALWLRII